MLWGLEVVAGRGPKPRLSLEGLVDAAIAIADDEGFDALSMRRLAERLGVAAMTIYTYVQGKDDLLDLMYEHIVGESLERSRAELSGDAPWISKLETVARERWEVHRRHPWFSRVPWIRTPLGPKILDTYELCLSVLDGLGLEGREMSEIFTLLSAYVDGAARGAIEAATSPAATSIDSNEWWKAVSPVLDQIWDAERYPLITRYESSETGDPGGSEDDYFAVAAKQSFEFGLARVLSGIELYISGRRDGHPPPAEPSDR